MKDIKLTKEEQAIEDLDLRPVTGEKREKIEAMIKAARKSKSISLRISGTDLMLLRDLAENEGIPYQTLITSILHKYVTDQLIDRDEIKKAISLLRDSDV